MQTAHAGGTYNGSLTVKLWKAPSAGDVLVLFFEQNQSASFPYSGQVAWPSVAAGSNWSYDGSTSYTAILHHVVLSGETGTYSLNVGGAGKGHEDYMVAEISGANTSSPVNARAVNQEPAGTMNFSFGGSMTPAAGTFPVAFFSAHSCCGGISWTSISSGWTIADKNSEYLQEIATGPIQSGNDPLSATATLSGGGAYPGAADVVLLNPVTAAPPAAPSSAPAPTASPTPAPSDRPSPTPAPTNTPAPSAYTFHGCLVYTANDWFTTNLLTGGSAYASNTVDPNSAAILTNFNAAFPGNGLNVNGTNVTVANQPAVNMATSGTPMHAIQGLAYGFADDPFNDDPAKSIPWQSGFIQPANCGSNDCHNAVLNTQTCVDYETYDYGMLSWNGSGYTAEAGFVHNLNHPFNSQFSKDSGLVTKAGIPYLGTVDFGEDAALPSINHIALIGVPGSDGAPNATGGYVDPATGGNPCTKNCAHPLPFGARLRLNSSKYTCPSAASFPQAHKICVQLESYGGIVVDHNGQTTVFGLMLGPASTGANPWNQSDVQQLNGIPITDFDVMTLGTIH